MSIKICGEKDRVCEEKLQEGDNLNEIKARIKARDENDRQSGHSVVFKSYIKDSSKNIIGFKYYDYSGINKTCNKGDGRLFLGANLKDIK